MYWLLFAYAIRLVGRLRFVDASCCACWLQAVEPTHCDIPTPTSMPTTFNQPLVANSQTHSRSAASACLCGQGVRVFLGSLDLRAPPLTLVERAHLSSELRYRRPHRLTTSCLWAAAHAASCRRKGGRLW